MLKLRGGKQPGTGTGDKQPAGAHALQPQHIEVMVFLDTLFISVPADDEFGRVQQHGVKQAAVAHHLARIDKGIRMHEVNALTVDISVSLSHGNGFLIQIHSRYLRRSAQHLGGNGKAAAVAAQVQHRSPLHQGGELEAVVPLVTEKARLVPLGEVHFIGDAVFHNLHQPDGGRGCRRLLRPDTLHAGNALIHLHHMAFCAAQAVQQGQPAVQPLPDGQSTHLQAQHVRVTVHHQAAQAVGISVQHAVRISGFIQAQNFPAQLHGAFQCGIQIPFGKSVLPVVHHAQRRAAGLIPESGAEQFAVLVIDVYQASRRYFPAYGAEHAGEHGRIVCEILQLHPGLEPLLAPFRRLVGKKVLFGSRARTARLGTAVPVNGPGTGITGITEIVHEMLERKVGSAA